MTTTLTRCRADKGTATFSDYANAISADTGSGWETVRLRRLGRLRPQKMGITRARRVGVGEAPFREMGVDGQTTDFTVVGIGDMSGECSATMLLSRHVK